MAYSNDAHQKHNRVISALRTTQRDSAAPLSALLSAMRRTRLQAARAHQAQAVPPAPVQETADVEEDAAQVTPQIGTKSPITGAPARASDIGPAPAETLSDSDRLLMQSRTHIRILPKLLLTKLPSDALQLLVDESDFEAACKLAAVDHAAAARRLAEYAKPVGASALVEFATLCLTGPVGLVGSRRALRATAILLLDMVLDSEPTHAVALCRKGEALLPPKHTGKADVDTPMYVLKEAYAHFCKAADTGNLEGKFLKGRWLITMSLVHKHSARAIEGRKLVRECAEKGVARALVFLAQCYEFPGRFSPVAFAKDVPSGRLARERVILDLYMRAAELGDADALNDVGSSYATSYAGLPPDFDAAVRYYIRAIQAGSLHAFDNLGTHYETGMSSMYPDRIDNAKALHYYQRGASLRCAKCCANLASAYEEGLPGVLRRDTAKAEQYYRHTVFLADDDNDALAASRALKDLVALYVARIKMNPPGSDCVRVTMKKLDMWLPRPMIAATLADVDKAIVVAVRGKTKQIVDLLGEFNGTQVSEYAKQLVERVRRNEEGASESDTRNLDHVFGSYSSDILRSANRRNSAKRKRSF